LGSAVAGIGDVDGDGVNDYAIGTPGYRVGSNVLGKVSIYSGATGQLLWEDTGDNDGDQFGFSVAGDGSRIVVGAPAKHPLCDCYATSCDRTAGYVKIYLAQSTKSLVAKVTGSTGGGLGTSVAVIGDVTSDGISDIVAGEPYAYLNCNNGFIGPSGYYPKGDVQVIDGSSGSVLTTIVGDSSGFRHGAVVGAVGDVNGDGIPDFGVAGSATDNSTPAVNPKFKVYSGANSHNAVLYSRTVSAYTGDAANKRIAKLGHINGDSYNDFGFGDPANDQVIVISGSGGSYNTIGTISGTSGDHFGDSVSGIGDLNGDGIPDIVVGAPGHTGGGQVSVISGTSSSWASLGTVGPVNGGGNFGANVDGMPDVDGDGKPDFLVGAPNETNTNTSDGSAYLFAGPAGSTPQCSSSTDQYLQNMTIAFIRDYRSHGSIYAGHAVTSGTQGDVVLNPAANVTMTAGTQVKLDVGFAVQSGSQLNATINSGTCP
jgi:hypothetical protein